jgi:plastocyanin
LTRLLRAGPSAAPIARLVVCLLAIAACGGDRADAPGGEEGAGGAPERAEAPVDAGNVAANRTDAYVSIEVPDAGRIVGAVRYDGPVPAPRDFEMEGDAAACGAPKRIHAVETGPDGGLSNAVVALTEIRRGAAAVGAAQPTIDQRGCEFVPPVIVAHVGDTVRVLNSDPITHNVHTVAFDNRTVNRSQPAGASAIPLVFTSPERIKVQCDIHPWMSAWIIVTEHPYATVTDEAGRFDLPGVPPGEHALEVWHEALGAETRAATVEAGATTELAIELTGRGR